MNLIDRGMSNDTENMKTDTPANDTERPTGAPEGPRTPEEVMQAAAARIAELEGELADMKDRWIRSEAENANIRARAQREVNETRQYAVQKFAQDVVEAAENLRRGLDSLPPPANGEPEIVARLREGLDGIERSFLNILERNGIKREDPTGSPFDPNMHQAMSEQESAAHTPGSVMHAWTPVWTLNGRLLRPAMVVVAKAPPAEIGSASSSLFGTAKLNTTA
jgi:molecular chaperone GrpE